MSSKGRSLESLNQRFREGKTSLLKIEFAAHFGCEEARNFLGEKCPALFKLPDFDKVVDASECTAGLCRFGKEICARIALAVCRVAMRDIDACGNVAEASRKIIAIIEDFLRGNHDSAARGMRALVTEDLVVELTMESAWRQEEEDALFSIIGGASVVMEESLIEDDFGRLLSFQPTHFHFDFVDLIVRDVVPWALGVSD